MLLSKETKFVLLFLAFLGILYLFLTNYLGPGVGDFSESILNNYFYNDSGHFEKTIVYLDKEGRPQIVIDARVDDYKLEGENLYVARRPREVYKEENVVKSRLSSECEYVFVNTNTHVKNKVSKIEGLSCR